MKWHPRIFMTSTFVAAGLWFGNMQSAQADGVVGFVTKDGDRVDEIELFSQRIEYRCRPGEGLGFVETLESRKRVYFVAETPAADDLWVRLENISPYFEDLPFSERDYDRRGRSDKIDLAWGQSHRRRTFSVWSPLSNEIQNTIRYAVVDDESDQTLESGEFNVLVSHYWKPTQVIYDDPFYCDNPFDPIPIPLP